MMRILVVDDEALIREVIKEYSLNEGYAVDEAENGEKALNLIEKNDYDVVIMDVMMPSMDGLTAIRELKQIKNIPVIILSARKEEYDKLQGFDIGIDDYVTKPFSPKELIARIKAVTKRQRGEDIIKIGNIEINNLSHEVKIDGEVIEMTHTQYELLKLFTTNPNVALSREMIIEHIWGYDYDADDRTIDAHIKLLRSRLGKYKDNIKTVRKVGYKFEYEEK
ncbi:MAG: response regulator transcription factor [Bacilli bacterium]|nr:response regulator transcription factor [Bacilli bacterium]